MLATFLMTVFYTQVMVSVPGAPAQALLWTDEHVAQGFAWSPETVGFGLPDADWEIKVVVRRSDAFEPSARTLWAVQTPLDVPASPIIISTPTGSEHEVDVPIGRYNLVFEVQKPDDSAPEDRAYDVQFHLLPAEAPSFAILKQGELESASVLRETTEVLLAPPM